MEDFWAIQEWKKKGVQLGWAEKNFLKYWTLTNDKSLLNCKKSTKKQKQKQKNSSFFSRFMDEISQQNWVIRENRGKQRKLLSDFVKELEEESNGELEMKGGK